MGVIRNKKAFFAFLLPGLLFYIVAVFYPIEESIRLSFMEWGGIGEKHFVGFQNYITMFHDKVFYTAFFNNLTQTSHIKNGLRTLKNQYFNPQNSNHAALCPYFNASCIYFGSL